MLFSASQTDPHRTYIGRKLHSKRFAVNRGIIRVPAHNTPIMVDRREALLIAIAKARHWIEDLTHGHVASFAAIARCGKPPRRSWSTWSTIRSR